jgi:hypothetical protein
VISAARDAFAQRSALVAADKSVLAQNWSACGGRADFFITTLPSPALTQSGHSGETTPPWASRLSLAARLSTDTVERKAGSCIGAQELGRHFSFSQFVKRLTRAVQRNDVINVHLLELSYRLSHIIFSVRR